jgi:6,7-dimethyl-8-ribityllumazine synthase
MIKAISYLRPTANNAAYERLSGFLAALGFAQGKGWQQGANTAASFSAPLGKIEVLDGRMDYPSDIFVEVTSIDGAYQAAEAWLRGKDGEPGLQRLKPIEATSWESRMFTVEPEAGVPISFWAWISPSKGKAIAIEGDLSAAGMKFGIVVARWNAVITDRLLDGALDALLRSGARREDITVVRVPGAWEVPAAARTMANQGLVDGIITLGCLLRGETAHYEAIYNEVARGIGQSQQETGIPHSFGVLTCETLEQALNRAGIKAGNKGFEAAAAAIEMVSLKGKMAQSGTAAGGPA